MMGLADEEIKRKEALYEERRKRMRKSSVNRSRMNDSGLEVREGAASRQSVKENKNS